MKRLILGGHCFLNERLDFKEKRVLSWVSITLTINWLMRVRLFSLLVCNVAGMLHIQWKRMAINFCVNTCVRGRWDLLYTFMVFRMR